MTTEPGPLRKIIHIDMDAFYASVEQRDDPALRGLPIAVGGARARGVVAAASYEARRFGVRSAMPAVTARRLCPDLVFVKPRFDVYAAVSEEIRTVFAEHSRVIEPVSLDEAYLDVTENLQNLPSATAVARAIRAEILARTGLVASAGVSYNKFLAKVASDYRKPDALYVITPAMGPRFVEDLPIGRFHGVGPKTEARMRALGIETGRDLRDRPLEDLMARFGTAGTYYHGVARGIDERPVRAHRIRKSIGAETTFADDVSDFETLAARLGPLLDRVWQASRARDLRGRTVTLKLKFSDFAQMTRARSQADCVADREGFERLALGLLREALPLRRSARLVGISLSGLDTGTGTAPVQLALAV